MPPSCPATSTILLTAPGLAFRSGASGRPPSHCAAWGRGEWTDGGHDFERTSWFGEKRPHAAPPLSPSPDVSPPPLDPTHCAVHPSDNATRAQLGRLGWTRCSMCCRYQVQLGHEPPRERASSWHWQLVWQRTRTRRLPRPAGPGRRGPSTPG